LAEISTTLFSDENLKLLVQKAIYSSRLRQHCNIHKSYSDPCQRLLNAVEVNSYIRPHRHSLDQKIETLIAIQGKFALLTFDIGGELQAATYFGTEQYRQQKNVYAGVEIAPDVWHTVISFTTGSILLEIKPGPFDLLSAKDLAVWAPPEGSMEAVNYLAELRGKALEHFSKQEIYRRY